MERRVKSLRRKSLSIFLSICLSLGFMPSMGAVANAAPGTQVYVEPSLVGAKAINDTFFVDVKVAEVVDLYGFGFNVSFNPSVLEVQSVKYGEGVTDADGIYQGPLGPADNTHVAFGFGMTWDNTAGTISNVNATRLATGGTGYDQGVTIGTAGASLARITFKVKALGLSNINLSGDFLSDSFVQPIAHSTTGGAFDDIGPISSSLSATPNPTAGATSVTLTATVNDTTTGGSNIAAAEYRLDTGSWTAMAASDGTFDGVSEAVTANINVSGLSVTNHTLEVRGKDAANNWGDPSTPYTLTVSSAPDTTAPSGVTDLATSEPTSNSIKLSWTALGDDGATGTASSYDIRYSTSVIDTNDKFAAAILAVGEPAPQVAGSAETFVVTGLSPSATYYFALKTSDEVPNVSGLSNSPSGTTLALPDQSPTVTVANPVDGSTVSGTVNVVATAADDVGISRVEFYIDDVLRLTDTAAPYEYSWNTVVESDGAHSVKAVAYDTIDQPATDTNSVSVDNIISVDNPPAVSITNPSDGSTVSGTVSVIASATDDIGVSKVEFYIDDDLKLSETVTPYEYLWNTVTETETIHEVKVIAYDTANQVAQDINSVTVDNVPPPAEPPAAQLAQPAQLSPGGGGPATTAEAAQSQPPAYGRLRGKVLSQSGKPVGGAAVRVGTLAMAADAQTGDFAIPDIATGVYTVHYGATGYLSQTQEGIAIYADQETIVPTVIMAPESTVADQSVTGEIQFSPATISGKVVNVKGKPVANASVRIDSTVLITDRGGNFHFTKVVPGVYTLHYNAAGYVGQTQVLDIKSGDNAAPKVILKRAAFRRSRIGRRTSRGVRRINTITTASVQRTVEKYRKIMAETLNRLGRPDLIGKVDVK